MKNTTCVLVACLSLFAACGQQAKLATEGGAEEIRLEQASETTPPKSADVESPSELGNDIEGAEELVAAAPAVAPGDYCYLNEDNAAVSPLALVRVEADSSVIGSLDGPGSSEESRYPLYIQVFEGDIAGDQLDLSVMTYHLDKENTESEETWTISSTELVTDSNTIESVDNCGTESYGLDPENPLRQRTLESYR